MKTIIILFCLIVLQLDLLRADSEGSPYAYVAAAWDGRYYFKMIPGKRPEPYRYLTGEERDAVEIGSIGIAYEVLPDGSSKELWRTEGWYSYRVYLSRDGNCLVRMGPWNRGQEPSKDDLAIAFYRKGKLLKEYSTEQLMRDKSKVQKSISHYRWIEYQHEPEIRSDGYFHLRTLDGMSYSFDIETGEIKEAKKS
jgi:hypothetical protein